MTPFLYALPGFILSTATFFYGAFRFFSKGKPLYFQLLVCATGCYALWELWNVLNLLCGRQSQINVGLIGVLGCFCFLLSANYGSLDGIVDERKADGKTARLLALAAPAVLLAAFLLLLGRSASAASLFLLFLLFLPALPASYFSLKHLLLPEDPFGFLKTTRLCNFFALLIYIGSLLYLSASLSASPFLPLYSAILSLLMAGLCYSCEKGVRTWGTLI